MDPSYAVVHAEEDRDHWWFVGRRAVVLAELGRLLPQQACRIADLGSGAGGMLEALGRFGVAVGVEADPGLRAAGCRRGLDIRAGALPGAVPLRAGEWDVVCLFDVLEHLDDEAAALDASARLLAPGGLLVVTVPAYQWLRSRHDEILGHRRRYTARRLSRVVEAAGVGVERLTYFNTLLALPIMAARLLRRVVGGGSHDLHRPARPLNRLLGACFAAEAHLLRRATFPFGISIFLAGRRRA
ncbi:MAG TPA: class I SAM-dependent methyltransferase [Methylomirabilota bacterium]|nr:class I SAM-dependent methyltransferase [Methylomirabilota bacterium]